MKADDRLIVALDTPSLEVAKKLLADLKGLVSFYKIGFELFTAHGWAAVDLVKKQDAKIFLDLKLHDIPNTVAKTAAVICERDIDMFNLHALGGVEMMHAAREAVDKRAKNKKKRPLILGVTILTSHAPEDLSREMGIKKNLQEEVAMLAALAKQAGLDGVVSSPQEIGLIRKACGQDFQIVTPGIRPAGDVKGDQKRTLTPREAIDAGASYLVVGRPITGAAKPASTAEAILKSL